MPSKLRHLKPTPIFSQAASVKPAISRYGLNTLGPTLTDAVNTTPTQAWTRDIPSSGDSDNGLPEFTRSTWTSHFLLTLYAYLGSLEKPWELSKPGSDEVKVIQMLLDIVYPQSGYKVKLNDWIYAKVFANTVRITICH